MRKTWHPKSYSQQARILAKNYLMWDDKNEALKQLCNSYRHPLVVRRAIKNFIRNKKKIDKKIKR